MNKQNRGENPLDNDKQIKEKRNNSLRIESWIKLNKPNKFSFFTPTVMFLALCVNIISPAKLALSQSAVSDSLLKQTNEVLLLAKDKREEKFGKKRKSRQESSEEEELSFEETKESLDEEIDERYEKWENQKTKSQISHNFSAVTTIILTLAITVIGTGLVVIPSGKFIILGLGLITVLIQLNSNVFLLEKNLVGYELLEKQGLIIKEKLEYVETEEELSKLKNLFQELVLESLHLE